MGQIVVVVLASWLALNFAVVPLVGLVVSPRWRAAIARRVESDDRWVHDVASVDGYSSLLLSRVATHTCRMLAVEKMCLLVAADNGSGELIAVVEHGLGEDVIGERVPIARTVERAGHEGTAMLADADDILRGFGPGPAIVAAAESPAGRVVLCVATRDREAHLDRRELDLLREQAALEAIALADLEGKDRLDLEIRAHAEQRAVLYDLGTALARPRVDVAALAGLIGWRLGLDGPALVELDLAAHACEHGTATPLVPAEGRWRRIAHSLPRAESRRTADRVAGLPGFEAVSLVVRLIAERWDGRGPSGLATDRIPLASRILAVCDALRVLTSRSPYGPDATVETAFECIRAASGVTFDPTVVDAASAELLGEMAERDDAVAAEWATADSHYAGNW